MPGRLDPTAHTTVPDAIQSPSNSGIAERVAIVRARADGYAAANASARARGAVIRP